MYCTKCGAPNSDSAQFCIQCGNKFEAEYFTHAEKEPNSDDKRHYVSNTLSEDEFKFIQQKTDYYAYVFTKMRRSEATISWNWAAFFLGEFWFFYRKMYKAGFCLLALSVFLNLALFRSRGLYSLVNLLICSLQGMVGNYYYMQHVEKNISDAESQPNEKDKFLSENGGTSSLAIPAYIVYFILSIIISLARV